MAPSIRPTAHAEVMALNIGRTVSSMIARPPPSSPSLAPLASFTPSATMGVESLPRRPRPSKLPLEPSPFASAGTSHSVLAPSAAIGWLDQTNAVAWLAEVTQLLRAWR